MNAEQKICRSCSQDFTIEADDFSFYEKIGVLAPKMCPECRAQRRLMFRNERSFYKRDCDKCKKSVVSMYSPNKEYTVYCHDCWYSDDWQGTDYGIEYDPSKPFFEQVNELWKAVPKLGLIHVRSINSEYINISADNKNCYMIVESSNNEDCMNCYWIQLSKDLVDCSFTNKVERSYESDDCYDSYGLRYSRGCYSCTDSYFLMDCKGCMDCIGCVNLRQKQYCIFNEQYTKEEYEQKIKELRLDTHSGVEAFKTEFQKFLTDKPHKYAQTVQAVNSTGTYLSNVKNVDTCFHTYEAEDCRYCVHAWRMSKDNMDCDTAGRVSTNNYNCTNVGQEASNNVMCGLVWTTSFAQYSYHCLGSQELFACNGLRSKKYCILNKEYDPETYHKLTGEIIDRLKKEGIYGEFFPPELSCFGYNEACVQEQFPLTKEEALAKGFRWEDTQRGTFGKQTIQWSDVPDSIGETNADIAKEIFECTDCKKNYRIIPNEFSFYQKLRVPIPRACPECRHMRRFTSRGPNKLWQRSCMCTIDSHEHSGTCSNTFETNYAPDRPEILYCEDCYQKEVV